METLVPDDIDQVGLKLDFLDAGGFPTNDIDLDDDGNPESVVYASSNEDVATVDATDPANVKINLLGAPGPTAQISATVGDTTKNGFVILGEIGRIGGNAVGGTMSFVLPGAPPPPGGGPT